MKNRITLFCLLAFLCFIPNAVAQCTTATNGLFPATTYTPNCSGNYETLTSQSYTGEYSNVNVIANKQYSFSSSVTNDYITVTNATGTVVYASGTQPVIWDSGSTTGVIFIQMLVVLVNKWKGLAIFDVRMHQTAYHLQIWRYQT